MNCFRLSGPGERAAGVVISAGMVVGMVCLVILLWGDWLACLVCVAAGLLLTAGLGLYVANLLKAACVPLGEGKLKLQGLPEETLELSGAVCLETVPQKNGPVARRMLVFTDAQGTVVASVPTCFTRNQGAQAEPVARELAAAMGLRFRPSLEPWEYDPKARKEHQAQQEEQEKAARREAFRRMKEKLLGRKAQRFAEPAASEEQEDSDINYDALDDLR